MPDTSVVELSSVRKEYMLGSTRVEALRGVSLEVMKGEFLAIAGPSGSGKSTILNMIGCIDTPTSGTIVINGRVVCNLCTHEERRAEKERAKDK